MHSEVVTASWPEGETFFTLPWYHNIVTQERAENLIYPLALSHQPELLRTGPSAYFQHTLQQIILYSFRSFFLSINFFKRTMHSKSLV